MGIVQLVFVLIALLVVISVLFPGWRFGAGPVLTPNTLIGLIMALLILFIVYLLVLALFGGVNLAVR